MQTRYQDSKDDALALLSTGDAPRNEALDPAEVAAWTQVSITVLASDVALLLYCSSPPFAQIRIRALT